MARLGQDPAKPHPTGFSRRMGGSEGCGSRVSLWFPLRWAEKQSRSAWIDDGSPDGPLLRGEADVLVLATRDRQIAFAGVLASQRIVVLPRKDILREERGRDGARQVDRDREGCQTSVNRSST